MTIGHHRDPHPLPDDLLGDDRLHQLAAWGKRLAASGLSPGESGNMSCRTTEGFLITRTGVPLAEIEADDWVLVTGLDEDGGGLRVRYRGVHEPSRDAAVHATLYRRCSQANTVFHFHVGRLEELTGKLGVPATSTYHPAGTRESMEEIERFLDEYPAARYFVLVDHGIVAWGPDIEGTGAEVEARQLALNPKT